MKSETLGPQSLNAYINKSPEEFHSASLGHDDIGAFVPGKLVERPATGSGVLDGLSCGVKDVFDIAGCPTGYGNPDWEKTHGLPSADAIVVSKIRQQGAHIVGKTLTGELAFSLAGNNFHYGSPINPAATDRLTGGSSCGSAAAVAAGLCDIGLGTDTAGSIRAPASFCGVFGFRPTHGSISTEGVCHLAHSFDTVGWLTRDAHTLAAVGQVLLPDAPKPAEVKGWFSFENALASLPGITQDKAGIFLNDLDSSLGERSCFLCDVAELDDYVGAFRIVQFYQVWNDLGPWIQQVQPVLGPDVRERVLAAKNVTRDEYLVACRIRESVRSRFDLLLADERILVMPTVSGPAPMRVSSVAELNSQRLADLRFLCIASLAGVPQVSLPLLTVHGAPLGLSLIGAAGTDATLLALAAKLEAQGALQQKV